MIYLFGPDSVQDPLKAYKWNLMAAKENSSIAKYCLGTCLEDGIGVARDPSSAFKFYKDAANDGLSYIEWLTTTANGGLVAAQFRLGEHYEFSKDHDTIEKAIEYYCKAGRQGHGKALFRLGYFYQYGLGVLRQDSNKAIKFFKDAAKKDGSLQSLVNEKLAELESENNLSKQKDVKQDYLPLLAAKKPETLPAKLRNKVLVKKAREHSTRNSIK